jgi:hypothetical protein
MDVLPDDPGAQNMQEKSHNKITKTNKNRSMMV